MKIEELLDEIDTASRTSRRVWDISDQSLSYLPPPFFSLSTLAVLHLHHNSFTSLPPEFSLLTELCVLDLSSNQLKALPAEIVQLTKLSSLFLHENNIQAIPPNFTQLSELRVLSLGCNQFKGAIPTDIFKLENLVSLSFCANNIDVFPVEDIVKLQHLTSLNLSMNNMITIPSGLVLPPSLTYLNLSTNYLESLPPKLLGGLSSLKSLNLSYNNIAGFPSDFDNNQLTSLPIQISEMTHLTTLTLGGNPLPPHLLELHRTLKTNHFLFRVGVGAGHSIAHHVYEIVHNQRELTRLNSASNDRTDPRRVVVQHKEIDQLAKLTNLPPHDMASYFDEESGTSMSSVGFHKVISKAGYVIANDPALMDSCFSLFDLNGDGTVQIKELLLGFTVLEQGSLLQKLKFGFYLYDINHDGQIKKSELRLMLMKIGSMRGRSKARTTAATTTAKIDEFVTKVFQDKATLSFQDFVESALSDTYISDLFSLDLFFQRVDPRDAAFPSPHTLRKTDSTAYKDPRKLLIKKRETRELAKLTHMPAHELESIFDLENSSEENDSMSREKFREIMANTGLVISKDAVLLDCLFDVFDLDLSGTVERKELLVGLLTLHSGALTQKLKLGFHLYDENGDGSLERHELRGMLVKIAALQSKGSAILHSEIEDFVGRVFAGRRLLLFEDFLVAAQSDSHIAQLFALESIFRTIQK